jgi:hypothetical protein
MPDDPAAGCAVASAVPGQARADAAAASVRSGRPPGWPDLTIGTGDFLLICRQLRQEYPAYKITVDASAQSRHRYTATARRLGTHPYAFATSDAGRMRAALGAAERTAATRRAGSPGPAPAGRP